MPEWSDYQEETAEFFRSAGLEAGTNETVQGIRTSHDVDVVVRTNHVGFDLLWLVECKHWNTPVSKLHVLALREIVADTGADRGIMMAENGYQRGALEAAQLTNVQLTSLAELSVTARNALDAAQLQVLQERVEECRVRYWDLDKPTRIAHGLRPPVLADGYSGDSVVRVVQAALNSALRNVIPIECSHPIDAMTVLATSPELYEARTMAELISLIDPMIVELEERLNVVYRELSEG
jgi:restriction system protein